MIVKLGDTITVYANTHTPSTGAAVDADAVPGYRCYEETTGTPLLTGSFALLDDANTVGFYAAQLAITTANGFEAGKCYVVRITGVVATVTGVALVPFQVQTYDLDDVAIPGSAMTLADDAITSAKFDESTAFPLKSADTGSTAVARTGADSDTLETLSDQIDGIDVSGVAAAVWAASSRTLTQSPATVAAAVAGTAIAIQRGASFSMSVTAFGNISTRSKLWFSVKKSTSDTDAESIIQIEETGGLLYLNGAATTTTNGSLVVSDETTGAFTITLKPAATAALTLESGLVYDIKCLLAAGTTITTAPISAEVTPNVTLAVS